MRKLMLYILTVSAAVVMPACGPSPESLAKESIRLNEELKIANTRRDSDSIYREIAAIETKARSSFRKIELKEYERLAHPAE